MKVSILDSCIRGKKISHECTNGQKNNLVRFCQFVHSPKDRGKLWQFLIREPVCRQAGSWQFLNREFVAMKYFIFVFDSTHRALKADKLLTIHCFKFDVIPTPKEITSDCGISIRINPELTNPDKAQILLTENNIIFKIFENFQHEII